MSNYAAFHVSQHVNKQNLPIKKPEHLYLREISSQDCITTGPNKNNKQHVPYVGSVHIYDSSTKSQHKTTQMKDST